MVPARAGRSPVQPGLRIFFYVGDIMVCVQFFLLLCSFALTICIRAMARRAVRAGFLGANAYEPSPIRLATGGIVVLVFFFSLVLEFLPLIPFSFYIFRRQSHDGSAVFALVLCRRLTFRCFIALFFFFLEPGLQKSGPAVWRTHVWASFSICAPVVPVVVTFGLARWPGAVEARPLGAVPALSCCRLAYPHAT